MSFVYQPEPKYTGDGGNVWRILQHNLYINDVFFRSAKVAVIAIANIWFGILIWFFASMT